MELLDYPDSHVPSKRVAAMITLPGHAIYKNVELGSKPAKAYWNYPNTNYSSIRISGYSTSANSAITTPSPILDLKLLDQTCRNWWRLNCVQTQHGQWTCNTPELDE